MRDSAEGCSPLVRPAWPPRLLGGGAGVTDGVRKLLCVAGHGVTGAALVPYYTINTMPGRIPVAKRETKMAPVRFC